MHRSRGWLYERIRQDKQGFEFEKNPNVAPGPIGELRNPVRAAEARPLVLNRLLIGIGTAVAEAGLTVRSTPALVNEFTEAGAVRRS